MTTVRNQIVGTIPTDLSVDAATRRKRAHTMNGCFGGEPMPEPMPEPHNATLEQMMPTLLKLGENGNSFAQSLYDQWKQGKTLSAKQDFWVRKFYGEVAHATNKYAKNGGMHSWRHTGQKIHYACTELGTGASTHYIVCQKCGIEAEYDRSNNYSGD